MAVLAKISLRAQLAMLSCIALIPGFALLFWIRAEVRELQLEDTHQTASQLAQLVAETQASRTQGVEQLIATLAAMPALNDAHQHECGGFMADLLARSSTGYLNFGLLDASGRVICSASGQQGASLADNPAFIEAMTNARLTITPIARGRLIGRDVFSYMRAVDTPTGERRVVFVGFSLDTVAASLAHVALPIGGSLAVLTDHGDVVAAYPRASAALVSRVKARVAAMRAPTTVFTHDGDPDAEGIQTQHVFAAVRLAGMPNVVALAALPTDDAAVADARILTAVLAFGAFSLGTLLFAILLANHGIRIPIQRLLEAMAAVQQGNLEVRAGLTNTSPEVQTLADGFDSMTAQLQQRDLRTRQAQRMEAIGQLAGGIAHDFNNMLTVIIGFSEELRHQVTETGREQLEEVLTASARARELTHQLLAFSRRQVLKAEPLQLTRSVENLARLLQRGIGEHVTLDLQLATELPLVRVDRAQLDQVITNLVVNARDAMPDGGTVRISTDSVMVLGAEQGLRSDIPPGRYARLIVEDTGRGMDAETLSHVFEPFFTTKEHGKGTGLGLATVYGIVRQSGGYVVVDSDQTHGTRFEVYFPAIVEAPRQAAPVATPVPAIKARETILVVEDEPGVRRLAVTVLRRAGYSVLEAADANEAEAIAHTPGLSFSLLLTDVVLPGGPSGVSLGRSLKARRPELPVLHMSGYSTELSSMATAEERAAFVAKPFTPTRLLQAVRDALGGQPVGAPHPANS